YYDDLHEAVGSFDYVIATPPFNVTGVDKSKLEGDTRRFPFGLPRPDNANYLWIQLFYSALNENGRAGFVMANSASDARASEVQIRRRLIEERAVDVMVAISPNFFYTLPIAVTLWFLDRGKRRTPRKDTVLFLDARHTYRQVDRAHRDFLPEQIELLANTVRLYRNEKPEFFAGSEELLAGRFPDGAYVDVPGLCKVATIADIEAHGWSLNPGRYVGVAAGDEHPRDFAERLAELHDEFRVLSDESEVLRRKVDAAVRGILEA
ncbi:MAG: N-6 DNA methylase, partial [Gaiellaceae bacterium]